MCACLLRYSVSIEKADSSKGKKNIHLQGVVCIRTWGDWASIHDPMKTYFKAHGPTSDRFRLVVYLLPTNDLAHLIAYVRKDEDDQTKASWYDHCSGGAEYPDAETFQTYKTRYRERSSNPNSHGFAKMDFDAGGVGLNRVKVTPGNFTTLAVMFAQREKLDVLKCSVTRRLSWMLMGGNYEIAQTFVAQQARINSEERVQALAELNEDPFNTAMDLDKVRLCFYGSGDRHGRYDHVTEAPAWLGADGPEILEEMDVLEIREYIKDRSKLPPRLRHLRRSGRLRSRVPMAAPSGSALVVDLGFNDASRPASAVVASLLHEAGYLTEAKLYDRLASMADPRGVMSAGYLCEVMRALFKDVTTDPMQWTPRFQSVKMSATASGQSWRHRGRAAFRTHTA